MKYIIVVMFMSLIVSLRAQIDLSSYQLTENQIKLVRKMESMPERFSSTRIMELVLSMHESNVNPTPQRQEYIPPHTQQELDETVKWAGGGAFAAYAELAGMKFLNEEYKADCPNWAIFNFGRATGTQFLKVDVISRALSYSHVLQQKYAKDRENFPDFFRKLARDAGFIKYLIE